MEEEPDAPAASAGASLLDLPEDVLQLILHLVGFASAWPARQTCRRIRHAVEGVRAGELRAAADDPAALERLAALVRAGRLRADAVSITLERGRRRATRGALLRLCRAAAAVAEACAAAANAAGAAPGFTAELTLENKLLDADLLHQWLWDAGPSQSPRPRPGRLLTGLHLPPSMEVHGGAAQYLGRWCPRLRRLSFTVSWRACHEFGGLRQALAHLSGLPLEELAVRPSLPRSSIAGGHLLGLVDTPAGRSLRSLYLGDELDLYSELAAALLSFPRLERIASRLLVRSEAGAALLERLLQHGPLREVALALEEDRRGGLLAGLGAATPSAAPSSPSAAPSPAGPRPSPPSTSTSPPGPRGRPRAPAGGRRARPPDPPPPPGRAALPCELAALAACASAGGPAPAPRLESVLLSHPIPGDVEAEGAPPGYESLAALGDRLEVWLVAGRGPRPTATPGRPGALGAVQRLLPAARRHHCRPSDPCHRDEPDLVYTTGADGITRALPWQEGVTPGFEIVPIKQVVLSTERTVTGKGGKAMPVPVKLKVYEGAGEETENADSGDDDEGDGIEHIGDAEPKPEVAGTEALEESETVDLATEVAVADSLDISADGPPEVTGGDGIAVPPTDESLQSMPAQSDAFGQPVSHELEDADGGAALDDEVLESMENAAAEEAGWAAAQQALDDASL
eukprot:tig00020912_g15870.t1